MKTAIERYHALEDIGAPRILSRGIADIWQYKELTTAGFRRLAIAIPRARSYIGKKGTSRRRRAKPWRILSRTVGEIDGYEALAKAGARLPGEY